MAFLRHPGPPPEVVTRAGLPHGERALAGAPVRLDGRDGWLFGTRSLLVAVTDDVLRVPWEQVESADWDQESGTLSVAEVGEFGLVRPVHRFTLDATASVLQLVRERVTASIVLQRRVSLGGRRGFSVVGRRSPAGGEVRWLVEYDAGVDPEDPAVAAAAEDGVRRARAEVDPDG